MERLLRRGFGHDRKPTSGGGFYARGWKWPQGVCLNIGHNQNEGFMIVMPGGACDLLSGPDLWVLLRALFLGRRRCTRLDIRCDVWGDDVRLIDDATGSCEAGELCWARRFKAHVGRDARTREIIDHGLELGSRSSTRYVRIYDKGLESGSMPRGRWVRYEVELKDDAAHQAAVLVLGAAGYEAGMEVACGLLIGAVDFREVGSAGHLGRRRRPKWFADFCGSVPGLRPRVEPELRNWEEKVAWIREQVAPSMRAWADAAGCTMGEMMEALAVGVQASESASHDPAAAQIGLLYREQRDLLWRMFAEGT